MRIATTVGLFMLGVAALLGAWQPPAAAAPEPLTDVQRRAVARAFKEVRLAHKSSVSRALSTFKVEARGLRSLLKQRKDHDSLVVSAELREESDRVLSAYFTRVLTDTRAATDAMNAAAYGLLEDHNLLQVPLELSGDRRSLMGETTALLNATNERADEKVIRAIAGVERAAAKFGVPFSCNVGGVPDYLAPHIGTVGSVSSEIDTSGAFLFTIASARPGSGGEPSHELTAMGIAGIDLDHGGVLAAPFIGVFAADKSPIIAYSLGHTPNRTFQIKYSDLPPGPKVVAIDLWLVGAEDDDFDGGFQTGSVYEWLDMVPRR